MLMGVGAPGVMFCGLCGWDEVDARCVNLWCERGPLGQVEQRLAEVDAEVSVLVGVPEGVI